MIVVGGREEIRTPDPLLAKQVLSQLSYTPTVGVTLILKHFPTFLPLHFMVSSLDRACKIWFILRMEVHLDNKTVPVENEHPVLSNRTIFHFSLA